MRARTLGMERFALAFSLAAGAALLGCAGSEPAPEPAAGPTRARERLDPLEDAPSWRPGDRAVFRVLIADGERERAWRVEIVDISPPNGLLFTRTCTITCNDERHTEQIHVIPVLVAVGEEGADLDLRPSDLPKEYAERGLYELCERLDRLAIRDYESLDPERRAEAAAVYCESLVPGYATLQFVLDAVQQDERLSELMYQVVEKPSLFSVLWSRGVELSITPDLLASRRTANPLPGPHGELPAYLLPVHVTANDSPALEIELVACPPRPPLHVAAGVVRLVGWNPEHPERRVTIDLVGARRGGPLAGEVD